MSKQTEKPDVGTTGHSWDGIEELNNPLPRWWVWVFYLCIAWGIWYTIAYPAWPGIKDATAGYLGYSTRGEVAADIKAVEDANAALTAELASVDLATLADNAELNQFAVNAGGAVFRANCSQCHGSGAAGAKGYPNLLDDEWLWGGRIDEIAYTVSHGIRNEQSFDARGFGGEMPAFDGVLADEEIDAVVAHVLALAGEDHDAALAETGATLFLDNCAACHGDNGEGSLAATRSYEDPEDLIANGEMTGAPALNNKVWLFGGDAATIRESIVNGRAGVMPAWNEDFRPAGGLTRAEVNAVAAYVHQLGGGQ
ncbi:cytochrome-c oxidase, cbb3-type subunit III [Loktanella sp. IMCC34160]|uniref:cytochrome-c oxidase, cbb3-type subunit III n=1 Tax=Loktanella sp. IMCC34160 TaxID=2510646 RepID=UPI00101E22D9|nr:cytochrome-c oxidase, cbb3-type subunit III [Loktanella sp. IMCC34160]RYG92694.1 cytochrome-c oxidase, cbb3-type subunit III [Loktanella sp. IMCC34160]